MDSSTRCVRCRDLFQEQRLSSCNTTDFSFWWHSMAIPVPRSDILRFLFMRVPQARGLPNTPCHHLRTEGSHQRSRHNYPGWYVTKSNGQLPTPLGGMSGAPRPSFARSDIKTVKVNDIHFTTIWHWRE